MDLLNRAGPDAVALETTLLVHGVPPGAGAPLYRELVGIVEKHGMRAAAVGLVNGRPTVGLTDDEIAGLLQARPAVPKANTANLGALMFRGASAATTVSATMELAAAAGVRIFATGGLGGVHQGYGTTLDISADLAALTRFPVAVVASGVKSLLDVAATRELLESLGVPVIGYRTDCFPAFYVRQTDLSVDARFDDAAELAAFASAELHRTSRAVLIVNPVPEDDAIRPEDLRAWLDEAWKRAAPVRGRNVTPELLARLHEVSGNATLRANLSLVRSNTDVAAQLCAAMQRHDRRG